MESEVLGGRVLDVVVDGKDGLGRVEDPPVVADDGVELAHDRRRVVVRQDVLRTDGDKVAGSFGQSAVVGEHAQKGPGLCGVRYF